jgi:hypothetical protein
MDALCASSYPELLDACREAAARERRGGLRNRVLDHIRQHGHALWPVEGIVNLLGPITRELGPDADVAERLRQEAERLESLAKVLWAYSEDLSPVQALEAAE